MVSQLEAAAIKEYADRQNMALRIFRPMKHQEPVFEQPRAKYTLLDGGNRAGKTITASALTSAIALDEKIIFSDGRVVDARMPWQKNRVLTIWLVCIDQRHIGEVIYPGIFKPGMFKVVYDRELKQLRTFNPDTDDIMSSKPSPAFIPPRFVESESWAIKADNIFNRITVRNPATGQTLAHIHAFTSRGDAPQGRAVDFIFIDEQLANPGYLGELQTRLVDKNGQMLWASWADEDSEDLAQYTNMVDENIKLGNGIAKRISIFLSDNKHLGKEGIAGMKAGMSEDEWLQRSEGIRPSEKVRMYPAFDKMVHTAIVDGEHEDRLSQTLRTTDGIPPDSWTKMLVLDPGTSHPAVLLCAVPPTEYGDYFVPYQEIYPGRADPMELAKLVHEHTLGQRFYKFIIDKRAGRQQTLGMSAGDRVVDAYSRAFAHYKIECMCTKSQFVFASDDVGGRQLILAEWMHPKASPLPKLRIVTHRCPLLCEQLRKVKKRVVQKEVKDDRKIRGSWDLADCAEYGAAANLRYIPMKPTIADGSLGYQRYMRKYGNQTSRPSVKFGVY